MCFVFSLSQTRSNIYVQQRCMFKCSKWKKRDKYVCVYELYDGDGRMNAKGVCVRVFFLCVDKHAWGNVHGHEFLEKKFACIGNVNSGHTRLVLASLTFKVITLEIGNGHQSTNITHMNTIGIRCII